MTRDHDHDHDHDHDRTDPDDVNLRRLFQSTAERDPGFTWRVLTALPPRQPRRRLRLILLLATAIGGGLLSFFVLSGASAIGGALPVAGQASSLFPTAVVLLALAAAVLALVSEAAG